MNSRSNPLFDLHDHRNLDARVEGEGSGADGQAGVPAFVAKNFNKQVGATVDHLGLIGEVRRAVYKSFHPHDALHAVERTDLAAQRGEQCQGGALGGVLAFLKRDIDANFAGYKFARFVLGNVSGQKDQIARAHCRHVVRDRLRGFRQFDFQLHQTLFCRSGADARNYHCTQN